MINIDIACKHEYIDVFCFLFMVYGAARCFPGQSWHSLAVSYSIEVSLCTKKNIFERIIK